MNAELKKLSRQIKQKERELQQLIPEWEGARDEEVNEKRRLDEAHARLNALHAKQGRASKFKTKPERDAYLKQQISSMKAYQTNQASALEMSKAELAGAKHSLGEVDTQVAQVQSKIEDGRKRVVEIGEQMRTLKERQNELSEQRKDKWREQTKFESMVTRDLEQFKGYERELTGMMDKVR